MASSMEINEYLTGFIKNHKKIALLLDYDGTLAPITPNPELSHMPTKTKQLLEKLSLCQNIFIGIISGRESKDAKKMAGIDNITYAGSHGFEIDFADGKRYVYPVPEKYTSKMDKISNALRKEVSRDGAWVENKVHDITFHYQETPPKLVPEIIEEAKEIVRRYGMEPIQALDALEILPPIEWHKGYAAEFILKTKFGDNWADDIKVIYAGDDVSDEKLMEMFKGKAATFRISSEDVKTAAGIHLKSLEDVLIILKWIENNICQN